MKKGLYPVRDTCRGDNPQGVHPQGSAVAGGIGKSGLPTHENKSLATVSQSCSTVTSTQTLYAVNENFTNLTTGDLVLPSWQISTTSTTGTVDTDGGGNKALKIVSSVLYGGFVRYFSTINGTSYTVKVKIKNTHQTNISIRRRDPNNYANYQQVTGQLKSASTGYVELTFTFTAQSGWEYYLHVQNQTATGTTVTYYADDIQVYYTGTVTQTLCTDDNSYRYGFNNQEKDNELYGTEGTAYDFGARLYDSRLGRFFSKDPLGYKMPGSSRYSFAFNSPVSYVDYEGNIPIPVPYISSIVRSVLVLRSLAITTGTTIVSFFAVQHEMGIGVAGKSESMLLGLAFSPQGEVGIVFSKEFNAAFGETGTYFDPTADGMMKKTNGIRSGQVIFGLNAGIGGGVAMMNTQNLSDISGKGTTHSFNFAIFQLDLFSNASNELYGAGLELGIGKGAGMAMKTAISYVLNLGIDKMDIVLENLNNFVLDNYKDAAQGNVNFFMNVNLVSNKDDMKTYKVSLEIYEKRREGMPAEKRSSLDIYINSTGDTYFKLEKVEYEK